MRILPILYKLYKPGPSTKQFYLSCRKKVKFWKMILSSLPQQVSSNIKFSQEENF